MSLRLKVLRGDVVNILVNVYVFRHKWCDVEAEVDLTKSTLRTDWMDRAALAKLL